MTDHRLAAQLTSRDCLLLIGFCLVLFGFSMISDRPLSMHEAVLPQSARTMLADGDWIVPKKGDAPWLESPPLPQWVTVCLAGCLGHADQAWVARLGSTLMSTAVVLMVAWMAARWFGRQTGRLSGLILATTCEFTRYSWLAEDEIYLCAIVTAALALFVRLEFSNDALANRGSGGMWRRFFGARSAFVWAFFVVLGMTNLAKGLLFGTTLVLIPIAGFLWWNRDADRISRYVWLWGGLTAVAVALAWPVAAYLRYHDVLELWSFDLFGRLTGNYAAINEPVWYYPLNLTWMLAPWTVVVPLGLWITRHEALAERYSPQRFLWCWALLIPIVLSIPQGKHHHYLLHAVAPWAVLSALGLLRLRDYLLAWPQWARNPLIGLFTVALPSMTALALLRDKLPGPAWLPNAAMIACPFLAVGLLWALLHRNPRLAGGTLFSTLAIAYCFGHWLAGHYLDAHRLDAQFLQQVRSVAPDDKQLVLDMQVGDLRGFLCLFYLHDKTIPLHNLSFLLDQRIRDDEVFLVGPYGDRKQLGEFGAYQVALQSERSSAEQSEDDRLTLFKVRFRDDVERISMAGQRISPMQSMYREDGPYLSRRL